jgi:hypothetical protein
MLRYDARTFKDTNRFQPAGNSLAAFSFENVPINNGYGIDIMTAGQGVASSSLLTGPSFTLAFNMFMKTIPNATLFYVDSANFAPLTQQEEIIFRLFRKLPPNRARQEGIHIWFNSEGSAAYVNFTVMGAAIRFLLPGDEWTRSPIFLAFSRAMDGTLSIWYNDRIVVNGTVKSEEAKLTGDLLMHRTRNIHATLLGMTISGSSSLNEGEISALRQAAITDMDAARKELSRTGAEISMPNFPAPGGLLLAIDVGNSKCYDNKTGPTTVKDLSVNSYTLRFEKAPTFDADNGIWTVTGNNGLSGPASSALALLPDDDYTVVFRCSTAALNQSSLFKIYGTGNSGRAIHAHTTWTDSTLYYDQGGCCESTQRLTAPVGNYYRMLHTYALVKSRGGRAIYIDGQQVASTTVRGAPVPLVSRALSIFTTDESRIWSGSLSHFMIWNRGLSQGELEQVHRYMAYPYQIRTANWLDADSYCRSMNMTLCDAQAICHRGYNGTVIDPARYVNVLAPVYGEENGWIDLTNCARVQRGDAVPNGHIKCCMPPSIDRKSTLSPGVMVRRRNPYFDAIYGQSDNSIVVLKGSNIGTIKDGASSSTSIEQLYRYPKEFQKDIDAMLGGILVKGNSYFQMQNGKVLSLSEIGLPSTLSHVDCLAIIDGETYAFSGKMTYRLHYGFRPAIAKPIAELLPGLPADFTHDIQGVLESFKQLGHVALIKGQRLLIYEISTRKVVRIGHVLDELLLLPPIVTPEEACRSIAASARRMGAQNNREEQTRLEAMLGVCRVYSLKEFEDAKSGLQDSLRRNQQTIAKKREEHKRMTDFTMRSKVQLENNAKLLAELDAQIATVEKIRCPTPGVCQSAPEQQRRCTRRATELPTDIRQHPDFYQYVERTRAPKCRAPSSNSANMAQIEELQRYMSEISSLLQRIVLNPKYQKISASGGAKSVTEVSALLGSMNNDMQRLDAGEDTRYILDRLTATKTLIDRRLSEVRNF